MKELFLVLAIGIVALIITAVLLGIVAVIVASFGANGFILLFYLAVFTALWNAWT